MKKIILSLGLAALAFAGCKERTDLINYRPASESLQIDSSYLGPDTAVPQLKNLLIEDFTGVRCQNCPKAQQRAEKLADSFKGRVVITGIHVTQNFATPYAESKYNFWTQDGENVFGLVGDDPGALPAGDLDRAVFPGKKDPFVNYTEWETRGGTRLQLSTPVNIRFLKKEFDETTRHVDVKILVTFTEDVADSTFISAQIRESGMIDIQAVPVGHPDTNYVHEHVLRAAIAPYDGLFLGSNIKAGQAYVIVFKRPLRSEWVADHCAIAAFVHHRSRGTNIEVLQVVETEIK
jgi:hypothetical protein